MTPRRIALDEQNFISVAPVSCSHSSGARSDPLLSDKRDVRLRDCTRVLAATCLVIFDAVAHGDQPDELGDRNGFPTKTRPES